MTRTDFRPVTVTMTRDGQTRPAGLTRWATCSGPTDSDPWHSRRGELELERSQILQPTVIFGRSSSLHLL